MKTDGTNDQIETPTGEEIAAPVAAPAAAPVEAAPADVSGLDQGDLQKSLAKLAEVAEDDGVSRKQALLEKAQKTELEKSEKDELFQLMGATEPPDEVTLADEVTASMDGNEGLQKALDVSEYLQGEHDELKKSLTIVADALEKSDKRQHGFNLILAKAVRDIGTHVVAMSERLGGIESQPARAPKTKGVQPLSKSFAGAPAVDAAGNGDGSELSKSQVLDAMEEMIQKSVDAGNNGISEDGIDMVRASSQYEQFSQISKGMAQKVMDHVKTKGGNVVH